MEFEHYGKCTILAGISGAGKTWMHRTERLHNLPGGFESLSVFSTDDYWTREDADYKKNFNPALLGEAHVWNFRRFIAACMGWPELIASRTADGASDEEISQLHKKHLVVDNTNTTVAEISPYYQVAQSYGFDVELFILLCPWHIAVNRNVHGLNEEMVYQQSLRMDSLVGAMPPWWKKKIIYNG